MVTKRLASVGAGDIPIAILLICLTSTLPRRMWLLCMTISMASRRAFGSNPYRLEISGDKRYLESLSRHCAVLMLEYIATVLYVKRLALAGRVMPSRSPLSFAEFLK